MAEGHASSSVECSIISIPCSFFHFKPNYEDLNNDESISFGLSSNTLVVNERTATNLNLSKGDAYKVLWVVVKLSISMPDQKSNICEIKKLIQVVIDNRVSDELLIVSEDFIYNLEYSLGLRTYCGTSSVSKLKKVHLSYEDSCNHLPAKASKVVLSLVQLETNPEDNFIDKVLQSYFSYPRYLCMNDVFGVHVPDHHKLDSVNTSKCNIIYFKVREMEGVQAHGGGLPTDVCQGYLVDSSVMIYQVSNYQDLHPTRRLAVSYACDLSLREVLNNDKLLDSFNSVGHNLIPGCFDETFKVLCKWTEPFLCEYNKLQGIELSPVFLVSGPTGSGKTLLIEALGQYFGINYWRMDCVTLGDAVPNLVESKIKVMISKLHMIAPCILHLSNIEALFEDADGNDDVRVLNCFEKQIKSLKPKWPVILIASTSNLKSMSSNVNKLFLESINFNPPNEGERENILSWLIDCNHGSIDKQILQAVGTQTSGFLFRDLEMLVSLAFKEKYIRTKEEDSNNEDFVFSDFSKIIGTMRKVFSESIGAPKVPSVSWKDVGGLEHLKKEILRSLRSNMFSTGLKRSGLLLHGPPGTGKTLLAKAVATQCGRNFLSVKGPELLNMYVGQSEHNVRDLFELAKAASPCIVFFDELDSLAPNRGRSGDSGGVMDRVVSQLLAEMDDLNNSADVFILGATNRPDLIDPALLRPGRLDKLLYVGLCDDRASQLSVLTALTRKLTLAPDVDLEQIVSSLPSKVSGAQLSAVCSAAWLASARQVIQGGDYKQNPTVLVAHSHFLDALNSALS